MAYGQVEWSAPVGVLILLIALVIAAIYYFRYKKIYLITFVASLSTYVFSIFFIWDVFELNKNLVLLILAISTLIMILIGKYFSNIKIEISKPHTSLKEKKKK